MVLEREGGGVIEALSREELIALVKALLDALESCMAEVAA